MANPSLFPAEWHQQSGVLIAWPHHDTDWREDLSAAQASYVQVAVEVLKRQKLMVVCRSSIEVYQSIPEKYHERLVCMELPFDDTWTRDYGPLFMVHGNKLELLDFNFNGWGNKFSSQLDNQVTGRIFSKGIFKTGINFNSLQHFILEGEASKAMGGARYLPPKAACLTLTEMLRWIRMPLIHY